MPTSSTSVGDSLLSTEREHPEFLTDIAAMKLSCDFLDKMTIMEVKFSKNSRINGIRF